MGGQSIRQTVGEMYSGTAIYKQQTPENWLLSACNCCKASKSIGLVRHRCSQHSTQVLTTNSHFYTVSQKDKCLIFYHNFGKCWLIFKILSLLGSQENFVCTQDFQLHFKCVSTLRSKTLQLLSISVASLQWETPEMTLPDVWLSNSLGQQSDEHSWCQQTGVVTDWGVAWAAADCHSHSYQWMAQTSASLCLYQRWTLSFHFFFCLLIR